MKNVLFSFFLLIFLFFCFEIICRNVNYLSKYTSYGSFRDDRDSMGRSNAYHKLINLTGIVWETEEFSYPLHSINSLGLFDSEKDIKAKIIILGDSFTQGLGAPPDSSFPFILEKLIKQPILNAGLSGSNPIFENNLLKFLANSQQPTANTRVFVTINVSDIADLETDLFLNKQRNFFIENSVAIRFIFRLIISKDYKLILGLKNTHQNTIDEMFSILVKMNSFCKSKNIVFTPIFHPTLHEYTNGEWHFEQLINKLEKNNISTIDIFSRMKDLNISKEQSKRLFWPIDGHNNSNGYKLIAEILANHLKPDLFDKK